MARWFKSPYKDTKKTENSQAENSQAENSQTKNNQASSQATRLPFKSVKVCGFTYDIIETSPIYNLDNPEERVAGQFRIHEGKVYIENTPEFSMDRIWETFWHEVFHMIAEAMGIEILLENDGEGITDKLARGMYAFLVDNNIELKWNGHDKYEIEYRARNHYRMEAKGV